LAAVCFPVWIPCEISQRRASADVLEIFTEGLKHNFDVLNVLAKLGAGEFCLYFVQVFCQSAPQWGKYSCRDQLLLEETLDRFQRFYSRRWYLTWICHRHLPNQIKYTDQFRCNSRLVRNNRCF
jgi:hypothetical protein